MSYRDDLNAAHEHIAALERELAACRGEPEDPAVVGAASELSPDFKEMMKQRLTRKRAVISRPPLLKAQAVPMLFSARGEAGQSVVVQEMSRGPFRGDELFAFDTSLRPGHGTMIRAAFVGQKIQFQDVPTWMFYEWLPQEERVEYEAAAKLNGTEFETAQTRSAAARLRIANAAARLDWDACYPAIDITFEIVFREACRWEAVLWGQGLL